MKIAIIPAVLYLISIVILLLINHFEFKRKPEKKERYLALPIFYKLMCPLIVIPLFIIGLIYPFSHDGFIKITSFIALQIAAIGSFAFTEAKCIQWYKENGYL